MFSIAATVCAMILSFDIDNEAFFRDTSISTRRMKSTSFSLSCEKFTSNAIFARFDLSLFPATFGSFNFKFGNRYDWIDIGWKDENTVFYPCNPEIKDFDRDQAKYCLFDLNKKENHWEIISFKVPEYVESDEYVFKVIVFNDRGMVYKYGTFAAV